MKYEKLDPGDSCFVRSRSHDVLPETSVPCAGVLVFNPALQSRSQGSGETAGSTTGVRHTWDECGASCSVETKDVLNNKEDPQGLPWRCNGWDCASDTGGAGFIPGQGTRNPCAGWPKKRERKKPTIRVCEQDTGGNWKSSCFPKLGLPAHAQ